MNGRKPSKAELIYINAAKRVGCVACRKMGHDTDGTEDYISFHHNPDKGSSRPLAHFFGYCLCPYHHQGVVPAGCTDPGEPIRHKNEAEFTAKFGSDVACAQYVWNQLTLDQEDKILELAGVESFDDLFFKDMVNEDKERDKNQQ